MASSFEKSVKGATKIKAAPPKTKYIEHILIATHSGEAGVGEVFRALQNRLRDSTWTVSFKALITVHLMIREGSPDVTLAYLAKHRSALAVDGLFSDAQTQGRNIRHYSAYLTERGRAFRDTKIDWVRDKNSRLEKLTVDKGLLRETEVVQHQLTALLKCDVMEEPENEITITVFRLLVLDLLALFQALNQGMINILGHFFEMSKSDAERAMEIYRTFTRQTDFVVQYLSVARQYEHHTRVEVPKLKHAPVNLGRQLEEYLKDPDFEIHRRQYLAEQEAKKSKGGSAGASKASTSKAVVSKSDTAKAFSPSPSGPNPAANSAPVPKGPDADLIDFFESIEQNQTPMAQPQPQAQVQAQPQIQMGMSPWGPAPFQAQPVQQFQQNGFAPQQTGFPTAAPFQQQQQQQPMGAFNQQQQAPPQLQTAFTGAPSFTNSFSPQSGFQPGSLGSIPQDSVASFQTGAPTGFQQPQQGLQAPQQITNPFRQSMMMNQQQTGAQQFSPVTSPISPPQQQPQQQQSTNPFARASPQANQPPFSAPNSNSPFQSPPPQVQLQQQQQRQQQQQQQQPPAALLPMQTGTNPFARGFAATQAQQPQQSQQQQQVPLAAQPTGSTNPFRQGAFVNHATGQGWQNNQQPLGGGLDQMETIPVFPRPAQQTPWQT